MPGVLQFGGFRLKPDDCVLEFKGELVHLQPKIFQLMVALIQSREKVSSREELTKAVWPELRIVEPNTFDQALFTLRKSLERFEDREYVRTVPRRGYRWTVEVSDISDSKGNRQRKSKMAWGVLGLAVLVGGGVLVGNAVRNRDAPSTEAIKAYEEGMKLWRIRHPSSEEHLRHALRLAPSFAPAHAGLAAAFAFHEPPALEAFQAVEKTLALDPNMGEAYATLGFLRMVHQWDWKGAEQAFERAVQLSPEYPTTHHWYGLYWRATGKHDKAVRHLEEAARLDPTAPAILDDLANQSMAEGRSDQALVRFEQLRGRHPEFQGARTGYWKAVRLSYGPDKAVPEFFASLNERERAKLEPFRSDPRLWEHVARETLHQVWAAEFWVLAGRKDLALEKLEEAVRRRNFFCFELRANPMLASLHSESRFQALIKKIGLEPPG